MPENERFVEKTKRFKVNLFNYDLVVVVSSSVQQSRSNRNDKLGYYEPSPHHGAMHCYTGWESYIFLNFGADIGSVSHEVSHFVWRVMSWIGAEHNNEVMAYMQGYYTREVAKFLYMSTPVDKVPEGAQVLSNEVKPVAKKTVKKKPIKKVVKKKKGLTIK